MEKESKHLASGSSNIQPTFMRQNMISAVTNSPPSLHQHQNFNSIQHSLLMQSSTVYEELPVGKSLTNNMMSEYPENYVPQQINVQETQPLQKRALSKVWKIRQQAYIEILAAVGNGERLSQFEQYLNEFICDANVNAQEKGFKILQVYVMKKEGISADKMDIILKSVVEKGLSHQKNEVVKTAQQVLVELFEKGKDFTQKIFKHILEGINNKNAKIVAGSIDVISTLLANYGTARLQLLKPFLKQIEKHAQTTVANIKNSIINFLKESYKWIGQPVISISKKFKKPIPEQLEKFISSYQPVQMIPLRIADFAPITNAKGRIGIDAYAFADPVDVISKYDEKWCQSTLQIQKWSQKKVAIDSAIQAFSTPKLVNKDYKHLISMIERLLADSNCSIVICGLRLLGNIANGLRKHFSHGAKVVFKEVLFKLRDKKTSIVEETHRTLKCLLLCMPFQDMIEKIKENLVDKAPNMKVQTLIFLKEAVNKKHAKGFKLLINNSLRTTMGDATVDVRDKTFELLCKIKATFGLDIFGNFDWKEVPKDKIMKIKSQPEIKEEEAVIPQNITKPSVIQNHPSQTKLLTNLAKKQELKKIQNISILSNQPQSKPQLNLNVQKQQKSAEISPSMLIQKLHSLSLEFKQPKTKESSIREAASLVTHCKGFHSINNEFTDLINQIAINLKNLLYDKNNLIVSASIRLAADLVAMCVITKTKGKIIFSAVLRKIDDHHLEAQVIYFIDKCLSVQSSFLFNQLISILSTSPTKQNILLCIQYNIQAFIPAITSQQIRSLLPPLLNCLNQNAQLATKAEFIIDRIARQLGQHLITSSIKQSQLTLPAKYMKKYKAELLMLNTKLLPKKTRLQNLQDPKYWSPKYPIQSQVQKLLLNLSQLPPPLSQLSSPFVNIDLKLLEEVITHDSIQQYSDLLIQWIFWRLHIERARVAMILLQVSKRLICSKLQEIELITLLSGTLGALQLGEEVLDAICSWTIIFEQQNIHRIVLAFYINAISQNPSRIQQLLYIIRKGFSTILNDQLVALAKIQEVKNNKNFIEFLKKQHGESSLEIYGFIATQPLKLKSKGIVSHKASITIASYFIGCFKNSDFNSVKLMIDNEITQQSHIPEYAAQLYVQIVEGLCEILLAHQVTIQNFDLYTSSVIQAFQTVEFNSLRLGRMIRTSVYLLADIDFKKPIDRDQMVKTVNLFLVSILERGNFQYLCEAIFSCLEEEVSCQQPNVITMFLFVKCLNRLHKNINYKDKEVQSYKYLLERGLKFMNQMFMGYMEEENSLQKKVRQALLMFSDSAAPTSVQINYMLFNKYSSNSYLKTFMQPFLRKTVYAIRNEKTSEEALREANRSNCTVEEIYANSKTFMKQTPLFEPQQLR